MTSVIDASVILAYWNREQGWQRAETELEGGVASSLIFAEVVTWLALKGTSVADISNGWSALQIPVHPFDETLALATGLLAPLTKPFGLSLADRACLVLARRLGAPVVTADRAWAKLDLGIDIRIIR
jgi:PIN domain nuclease of toxin-antitoxin system